MQNFDFFVDGVSLIDYQGTGTAHVQAGATAVADAAVCHQNPPSCTGNKGGGCMSSSKGGIIHLHAHTLLRRTLASIGIDSGLT